MLYAHRTSQHTTTGVSPFLLLYGKHPPYPTATQLKYDLQSYPAQIQAKLAEFVNFVHTNLSKAACSQKLQYEQHTTQPIHIFCQQLSLVSLLTAWKLDPRWEGDWVLCKVLLLQKFAIVDVLESCTLPDYNIQVNMVLPSDVNNWYKSPEWASPPVDPLHLSSL